MAGLHDKELLLTGRPSWSTALALQLALRVSIVIRGRIPESSLERPPGHVDRSSAQGSSSHPDGSVYDTV
jgi:hypothetical protein